MRVAVAADLLAFGPFTLALTVVRHLPGQLSGLSLVSPFAAREPVYRLRRVREQATSGTYCICCRRRRRPRI